MAGVPGAGVKAVLSAECCHLAGEVLDPLQKCGAVWEWTIARKCQLGYDLKDAVRTAYCHIQAAVGMAGEIGLYVWRLQAKAGAEEVVVWHVLDKAP
jgi:hypothetical protein